MKYNLLENSYVSPNTIIGNVSLSIEDVENILTISGAVTISGTNDDVLCIEADMGDRIAIYQMRYYFDSSTASGTVVSGIAFYYKDDEVDNYSGLTTNIGDGYYYTTVPGLSSPRYVRLIHTVSGTSITGDVVGLSVLNDDSVVDFGADGTLESTTVLTSLSYLDYNDYIREIEIYNDGSEVATAHIMLEPQLNDADTLMSISASENGPWTSSRDEDLVVVDGSLWGTGNYNNTNSDILAQLRLDDGQTVGTYTSHIFKKDYSKFTHIDINKTTVSGAIIATDADDYTSTIEVRSNHTIPTVLSWYQRWSPVASNNIHADNYYVETDVKFYDMWTDDGYGWNVIGGFYSWSVCQYVAWIDDNTLDYVNISVGQNLAGVYNDLFIGKFGGPGPLENKVKSWKHLARTSHPRGAGVAAMWLKTFFIKLDEKGGTWVYIYIDGYQYGLGGYTIDGAGYYLIKFNTNMDVEYKNKQSTDFITGLGVDYGTGYLWYIPVIGVTGVYKLDTNGTTLKSYTGDYSTDLKGLCVNDDGGCWIINGNSLYRLDSDANVIDSIPNVGTVDLHLVAQDINESDYLWIADGSYIKRIVIVDGRTITSTLVDGPVEQLIPKHTGVWAACNRWNALARMRFIGKSSGAEEKELTCNAQTFESAYPSGANGVPDGYGIPGVSQITYDNLIVGDDFPISDDPVWNNSLEWNKVNPDKYILPRENYHQVRLTLRRPDTGVDSPKVDDIYLQDSVEITDIYSGQSKTLYLKVSIPDGINVGGDYSSMLRVWWELPVN